MKINHRVLPSRSLQINAWLLVLGVLVICISGPDHPHSSGPLPTNGTIIREEGETGEEREVRETWLELMHQAAPGTDWRMMEYLNQVSLASDRAKAMVNRAGSGQEILADGTLIGTWKERGSLNQAGSVIATEFDPEAEEIWVISSGGTLYRGSLKGSDWTVVNQDYKFSGDLLRIVPTGTGRRILAVINKVIHYSDDDGLTWTAGSGTTTSNNNWGNRRYPIVLEDSLHTIYYLVQQWLPIPSKGDVGIYRSQNLGTSFSKVATMNAEEINDFCLTRIRGTQDVALLKKAGTNKTEIYRLNVQTGKPELQGSTSVFDIGDRRANLAAIRGDTADIYYTYTTANELYKSLNDGNSWAKVGTFDKNPWDVGVFISEANPQFMMMGEVECHRSIDGGKNWQIFNPWWAYYDDVEGSLHADMMYFNEFRKKDGTPFFLISNHGGLNITYDGATFQNLGLSGLNVSQYYDVVTDPVDELFIYAGAQDQGFQRATDLWEGDVLDFDQAISGDYGHMVFTGNGQHLWMVYPGGWISFWDYPVNGGITADYTIDSKNESVWIPPLVAHPDPSENTVFAAGGALDGGKGSYILKLSVVNFAIETEQLPFDFKEASGGEVSVLAFSPFDDQTMYAATTNGWFFTSHDQGQTWDQSLSTVPGGQYLYGAAIWPSRTQPGRIYFGGSGYSGPAMLVSEDDGMSFTSMNTGMPPTLVLDLAADPEENFLFAATETGPFVYAFDKGSWFPMMGSSAPVQTYWSVEYLPLQQVVRFGTYGRGIWDFAIEDVVAVEDPLTGTSDSRTLAIWPNPVTDGTLHISASGISLGTVEWQIIDLSGRNYRSGQDIRQSGNELAITVPASFPNGVYLVRVSQGSHRWSGKFLNLRPGG